MRILHTMLRVGDLDKSIDFYVNRLGMNLLRKKDYPHGKFTLAFVGYGPEKENTIIRDKLAKSNLIADSIANPKVMEQKINEEVSTIFGALSNSTK